MVLDSFPATPHWPHCRRAAANLPKRLRHVLGAILLAASVTLVVWQGSFSVGSFAPDDPEQTFVFYGISILIFLLMVTLGFMLVRLIVKLWIERSHDRPGSRISTKLVVGALALSVMPVFFMVLFNVYVLNRTMQKWFTLPEQHELVDLHRSRPRSSGRPAIRPKPRRNCSPHRPERKP